MKKALVIALFAAAFALVMAPAQVSVSQDEEALEFVGNTKCKMCHNRSSSGKFFDDWEAGVHAKAFEVLNEEEQKNPECVRCHTTGYGMPGGFVSLEETPKMVGVQCESCHGPGEVHVKSRPNDPQPHAWEPNEETCVRCHNEDSPDWDPERYEDEDGNKAGFIYKVAVKKVNHGAVFEELGKEPPKTGDL